MSVDMFGRASRGRPLLGLLAGATLLLGGGLFVSAARAALPAMVRIDNFSFAPDTLTVPVGTTVTWENGDDIPHSVVLADRSFRSKPLDTNDKASFTFAKAGTFTYFCGLHPQMHGTITVVQ